MSHHTPESQRKALSWKEGLKGRTIFTKLNKNYVLLCFYTRYSPLLFQYFWLPIYRELVLFSYILSQFALPYKIPNHQKLSLSDALKFRLGHVTPSGEFSYEPLGIVFLPNQKIYKAKLLYMHMFHG